ncbi:apolipoprotein N-acyltransferase [Brevundimonas sp.]|uniref:apolipoprotein N-acyltransferase n=1 Tax=Brevundimonas sp. TaxID=1871086 RepID=UPI0028986C91|nr:apolipoprotein N-acyltransferase [Brevundimonas sp.]
MDIRGTWQRALTHRWARIGLALAAGLAAGLVHPPFNIWPGLLGYTVLMLLAAHSVRVRGAFWMGWLFGFAYFFIGCWWVAEAFFVNPAQAWMAPFAASLLPAGIGLFVGAAAAVFRALSLRRLSGSFILFAVVFAAFEWLRGHVLTGFPWNPVGASWQAGSAPSQLASVVGVYGLGVVTLLAACAFGPLLNGERRRKAVTGTVLGVVILAGLFAFGTVRLGTTAVEASETRVRLVQANVEQADKWSEDAYASIIGRYLDLTTRPADGPLPQVILWPESALPDLANNVFARDDIVRISNALQPGQTLMLGLSRGENEPPRGWVYYNSMFALRRLPEGGMYVDGVYDKHRLVPFGEYLPLGDLMGSLGIRSLVHMPADLSSGPVPAPLSLPSLPAVQPLICYESLFPGFTAARADTRPDWIANVSNDAWFGQTTGPLQHLNLASYRAIETGLPMARATPTGVSAMIDPLGRIVSESRIEGGEAGFRDVWLPRPVKVTPYGRWGDTLLLAMLVLLIGGHVLWARGMR